MPNRRRIATIDPEEYSAGDLVEVANLIAKAGEYPSIEQCARDVIRAVVRLLADR